MLLAIALIASSIATVLATIVTMKFESSRGLLCIDIHKPDKPRIPCIGAPGILVGLLVGLAILSLGIDPKLVLGIALSLSLAFFIGLADDLVNLSAYRKIVLGVVPALPILMLKLYTPYPWTPFLGIARLTILYPLLVLVAFTVFINGANMIDTHNGVLITAALASHTLALVIKVLRNGSFEEIALLSLFVAVLASYLVFNAYPAKILNGNAGSFLVGAMIAVSAIVTRLEMYFILSNMLMFVNGFYYISSVGGFLQKERVERPIEIDARGCMTAKRSPRAPITLVRLVLLLSREPLSEKELVFIVSVAYIVTSIVAALLVLALGYRV